MMFYRAGAMVASGCHGSSSIKHCELPQAVRMKKNAPHHLNPICVKLIGSLISVIF
jgi:hypothetical protein